MWSKAFEKAQCGCSIASQSRNAALPIVLYAKDRGCDMPGHYGESCGPDHHLIEPGGWTTRKRKDGVAG